MEDLLLTRLVERGSITAERASALLGTPDRSAPVERLLVSGEVSELEVLQANASLGDYADESIVSASDLKPDADALVLFTGDVAKREMILPFRVTEGILDVAIPFSRATDVRLIDALKKAVSRNIRVFKSSTEELQSAIARAYRAEGELRQIASERDASDEATRIIANTPLDSIMEDSPAIRFVDLLLDQAIDDKASDIHIEQSENAVIVRFRLDGVLHDISTDTPKSMANEIITRIKILSDMDIAERRKPLDGRMSKLHKKRGKIDFRVASLPTVHGEKIVMRILDNTQASLDLPSLGFEEENRVRFQSAYKKPYGMILVTGPTGSGKSTTLYAALNDLVSPEVNIITVEDPVEYRIPRINQVQVNPKAGLTFAGALRSILRSDPDIVLIGEIRDKETAHIAVEAAQTGHLVLTTLHTNDAASAASRLVDLGVEPFLVGSVVESILAQRLVRRLCNSCKTEYQPDSDEMLSLGFPWTPGTPLPVLCEPVGCKACANTGYKGRMAIHEVLTMSPAVEKVILRGGTSVDIAEQALHEGMKTIREDGWAKVLAHKTSIQEILRVVG